MAGTYTQTSQARSRDEACVVSRERERWRFCAWSSIVCWMTNGLFGAEPGKTGRKQNQRCSWRVVGAYRKR
jgi:hypothetical protein